MPRRKRDKTQNFYKAIIALTHRPKAHLSNQLENELQLVFFNVHSTRKSSLYFGTNMLGPYSKASNYI